MTEILRSTIGGMQSAGQIRQSLALAYWPRVVGPLAAKSSIAVEVRNRILFVRTKSSVWSHELSMQKQKLLSGLNRLLEDSVIDDIKFRTDGTKWFECGAVKDTPTDQELDSVLLSQEEHQSLRQALNALESVSESHARQALSVRITTEAKLRHWRLEHGWSVCLRCGAIHKTAESICPICRLTS